jgi:hypothetical protein
MDQNVTSSLLLILAVVALDVWVYCDARGRQGTRREVTASIGALHIDRPEMWMGWCLLLFILFFPLYIVARRAAD